MTLSELYAALSERIPPSLSCEWDHDGFQICPTDADTRQVRRVLVALDPTAGAIDAAVAGHFELLLTHHPVIFNPVTAVGGKLAAAAEAHLAVMTFHTRLDALAGGVNDALAAALGLGDTAPFFGEDGICGRISEVGDATVAESAKAFSAALGGVPVTYPASLAHRRTGRLAILGGSGRDGICGAIEAGAATYLTGECSYNTVLDAAEAGLAVITAGHRATEFPVCQTLARLARDADGSIGTVIYDQPTVLTV